MAADANHGAGSQSPAGQTMRLVLVDGHYYAYRSFYAMRIPAEAKA